MLKITNCLIWVRTEHTKMSIICNKISWDVITDIKKIFYIFQIIENGQSKISIVTNTIEKIYNLVD